MHIRHRIASRLLQTICLVGLLLAGCRQAAPRGYAAVSSSEDTLTLLAGKLAVYALRDAGYNVQDLTAAGNAAEVRANLLEGTVDLAWFNTADTWHRLLGHDVPITEPEEQAQAVAREDTSVGLSWQNPAPYILRYALVMRAADLEGTRLSRMSELAALAAHRNPLVLCVPEEMVDAFAGVRGLAQAYRLSFPAERVVVLPLADGLAALKRGECDCALSYTVAVNDDPELQLLEDDRHLLPAAGYALAIRRAWLAEYPDIQPLLVRVNSWLTPANIDWMLALLDSGKPVDEVVQQFIQKHSR